jgi:hypothetical protein
VVAGASLNPMLFSPDHYWTNMDNYLVCSHGNLEETKRDYLVGTLYAAWV